MDTLMNWVIMALGMAGAGAILWVMNRPQYKLRDGIAVGATLWFCALFLRCVDDRLNTHGLSWDAIGSLDPQLAEDIFGGAFFMTSFIIGAIAVMAVWILPDVIRVLEAFEDKKEG